MSTDEQRTRNPGGQRTAEVAFTWLRSAAGLRFLILAPAVVGMSLHPSAPIHGNFYFRQAHVAANIEKLLSDGFSLAPGTYNRDVPLSVFDFPAYQLLVAAVSRLSGADPTATARLINVLIFVLTFLLIDRLLARSGVEERRSLLTLALFAYAPLNLFYYRVPIVDGLALLLGFVSLYAFVGWDAAGQAWRRRCWLLLMTVSGVSSTLVKDPVFLPFFVAMVLHLLLARGLHGPLRPGFLAFTLCYASTVVGFKLWSNWMNGITLFLTDEELLQYFGPWRDRLDPRSWDRILRVTFTEVLSPAAAVVGAVGAIWLPFLRTFRGHQMLLARLFVGAVVSLLVFFNRYTWHNYYQLPLVFPLAFFAANSLGAIASAADTKARWGALGRVPALVVVFTLAYAPFGYSRLAETPTEWILAEGAWIREYSEPDDFIVYLIDSRDGRDWNPVFLYFAKRDGYNLTSTRFKRRPEVTRDLLAHYAEDYGRVFIFCPSSLHAELFPLLESMGARIEEAGPQGVLYEIEEPLGSDT